MTKTRQTKKRDRCQKRNGLEKYYKKLKTKKKQKKQNKTKQSETLSTTWKLLLRPIVKFVMFACPLNSSPCTNISIQI